MRKVIAAINMTLDGFCDHEAVIADEELHQNYNDLFKTADTALFGSITYQLMESAWPAIAAKPTGMKAVDEFAVLIDNINKIVFSHTLKSLLWKNSILAQNSPEQELAKLKQQPGKNILIGSPTMIINLMKLSLIDEYQFCVQPIILGKGNPLFKNITDRINVKLLKTKPLTSGATVMYYEPAIEVKR